jgi:methylmalonyl-CoA/ethylmalonyl-CoA epimerase
MAGNRIITQLCIVIHDVKKVNANWANILGVPEATIETIFPDGIHHYSYDKATTYKDCQVAKYQLENIVLELLQPGQTPSPWRNFLEKNGQGVFHVCMFVDDRKVFQQKLSSIGVGLPYHIGYYPGGSYSYVDSKEQLGLELSVNHQGDYAELIEKLLEGITQPLDELR